MGTVWVQDGYSDQCVDERNFSPISLVPVCLRLPLSNSNSTHPPQHPPPQVGGVAEWVFCADTVQQFSYLPDVAKAIGLLADTPDCYNQVSTRASKPITLRWHVAHVTQYPLPGPLSSPVHFFSLY
jgi:hypothetical protein